MIVFLAQSLLVGLVFCSGSVKGQSSTYRNPIFPGVSADPAVYFDSGSSHYFLTLSTPARSITSFKSRYLTNFGPEVAEEKLIFQAPEGYKDVWASELHQVDGGLYLYFAMSNGSAHSMYVQKAVDPTNPHGDWEEHIKLMPDFYEGNIDGSLLRMSDGSLYMIWSSIACLWIAKMKSPVEIENSFVLLRRPTAEWECRGMTGVLCMSEGPFVIYNKGIAYLIFSSSETMSPHYNLGMMTIPLDRNPMTLSNWDYRGTDGPVFWRNDEEEVYCSGHAAFTVSPDGTETWMTYHGTDSPTNIGGNRVARVNKIEWAEDGSPIFPRPSGYNHSLPVPSGQPQ